MIEIPSLRPETRYGIPPADHMLFNRQYIVGYSYLFRQARWTMEVIDPDNSWVNIPERLDGFREDMRIPERFRAGLEDYKLSGHDRGHLVASAERRASLIENSETFLLSNMSPQKAQFNQGIWRIFEERIRELAALFLEVYVVSGPIFDIGKPIDVIGDDPKKPSDVHIPVPHAYFKSILAEDHKNKLKIWSFVFENKPVKIPKKATNAQLSTIFSKHLAPTLQLEMKVGLPLWDRIRGEKADAQRTRKTKIWSLDRARKSFDARSKKRESDELAAQQVSIDLIEAVTNKKFKKK